MYTNLRLLILLFILVSCGSSKVDISVENNRILIQKKGYIKTVEVIGNKIIKITKAQKLDNLKESLVVLPQSQREFSTKLIGDEYVVKLKQCKLIVTQGDGKIKIFNNGKIVLEEAFENIQPKKDGLITSEQNFKISKTEGLYGLGQFQNGYMNYRDKKLLLVQANKISVVPFLVSSNNYGILWDNYSRTEFESKGDNLMFKSELSQAMHYYIVLGDNIDEVISGYRTLSGKAPMFAKAVFGYWQSKERYKSFDELVDVVKTYRKHKLPIDNIVQDWQYWGSNDYWSSMYFRGDNFKNPKKRIQELHNLNVKLMCSIWPAVGVKSQLKKDLDKINALFPVKHWSGGMMYDPYNPEARDIYCKHIKAGLFDLGVDYLWMDGTEIEVDNTDTQEHTEKQLKTLGKNYLGSMAEYLNTFSLQTTKGTYEMQRKEFPNKRVYTLTRSAFVGQQRYASVTWSGDIASNWKTLKKQIAAGLNFSLAGIPYWTHDIGAFFPSGRGGNYPNGVNDPAYRELYTRWFQFGAFTPIFRSHGTGTPREVWQFGRKGEMFYDALAKALNLRYSLMPYVYSTSWKVTNDNYSMMRALVMDFPNDKNVLNTGDSYMFGNSLLVKPVCNQMYYSTEVEGTVIPVSHLFHENNSGLKVEYFNDMQLKNKVNELVHKTVDFNWGGGNPEKLEMTKFSMRWTGEILAPETGLYEIGLSSDDGSRMWIDNKLLVNDWRDKGASYSKTKIKLEKGKKCKLKIEYFQNQGGSEIRLLWKKPSELLASKDKKQDLSQLVYLPKGTQWFNYWTNKRITGGQVIKEDYPIDIFPLFVKAGSIIPMSHGIQYAEDKMDAPIEIRVYAGNDAEFELYEDENDTYNYEKGKYTIIKFNWDEKSKSLKIAKRVGEFKGMQKNRVFKVVVLDGKKKLIKTVKYNGNLKVIKIKANL